MNNRPIPIQEFEREQRNAPRIKLIAFNDIKLGNQRRYVVKGLIPRVGLTVVWGPPKSGKSFWTFDMVMHVALGWEYRGRRVSPGPVIYCAFEGQTGLEARVEAFRQRHLTEPAAVGNILVGIGGLTIGAIMRRTKFSEEP
jgi:RecA-family ATPase